MKHFMKACRVASAVALAIGSATLPTSAQTLPECGGIAGSTATEGATEVKSKSYANGKINLTLLDAGGPSHGPLYVRVEWPRVDAAAGETCRVLGFEDGVGFAMIEFDAIAAAYDPAKGLTLSVPTLFVLPEASFSNTMLVHMTINQATGEISTETELGNN